MRYKRLYHLWTFHDRRLVAHGLLFLLFYASLLAYRRIRLPPLAVHIPRAAMMWRYWNDQYEQEVPRHK